MRPYLSLLPNNSSICSTSGTLGKTAVIQKEYLPLLLNTSVIRFRTLDSNLIIQSYIHLYLKSELFLSQANAASTGSAQVNVGPSHLKNFEIPLPPLNEQKRIADRLDNLLTRIDKTKAHLDHIPPLLKRFRQSVLAAATSGKLTEDWREANGVNLDDWEESTFGNTGKVSGGLTKNSKRQDLSLKKPYLRVANVYANCLLLDDVAEIGITEEEFKKTKLQKDDLLIVEGNGSLDQIGRAALWNGEIDECSHQNHLIRWRSNSAVLPLFALFQLMSPQGRDSLVEVASSTTGLHTLSISKVSALPIPLPFLEEQAEIVRRVETLFAKADRIEAQYQTARQAIDLLTPALLAKAFRGELLPQDPNDEPASVLLDRIKAEKAQTPTKAKRQKKS